jgi:hypothetical protein
VAPWAIKHGFITYTQVHTPPTLRDSGRSTEGTHPAALPYDGVAIFDMPSLARFTAAFEDPYYKTVIAADEATFLKSRIDVPRIMGTERQIIVDGGLLKQSSEEILEVWRRFEDGGK